jgi:hypothetical protein
MLRRFSQSLSSFDLEIAAIQRMGSASLREATEAMMTKIHTFEVSERKAVMHAVCERALEIKADMRYWDLVSIIQSAANVGLEAPNVLELARTVEGKLSHLAVKHLIDLLFAYERLGIRSQLVFNRLSDLVRGPIYADELVGLTRVLARTEIDAPKFLESINRNILANESLIDQFRFLHSCEIAGALAKLQALDQRLLTKLESKCKRELEVMPLEELWKTNTAFVRLCYSFQPFEEMAEICMKETVGRLTASSFDQVTRPMDFFQFLRYRGLLTNQVLIKACKWANDAVYRPATRTQAFRRPTVFEVALLVDTCRELGVPMETVEKAVTITVTSKGGTEMRIPKPKPLRYRRRRAYLKEPDGYESMGLAPIKAVPQEALTREWKSNDAAFAPKLRTGGVVLWKERSGPWFSRK